MSELEAMMNVLLRDANSQMITKINKGEVTLEDPENILPAFLAANFISNPQIFDILEAMAGLIMEETMEKEYVTFFINKVKEIANQELRF
jgi:hypothetical protein